MNFEKLKSKYNWIPIRNCPDRFILRTDDKSLSPIDINGLDIQFKGFQTEKAKDIVILVRFNDGGLISYKNTDGTYLHTLNTVEGFERKLKQLEIEL